MDNKLIILFLASVILSGVHSVKIIKNQDTITINEGESYDLLCTAVGVDMKACAFISPYGKTMVFWPGAQYENGRIKQHGNIGKGQCGLTVNKALDTDNGKWKCNLSVQDPNGNSASEEGEMTLTVAVPPTKVALRIAETNAPAFYSVKMKQNKKREELAIDCIAEQARPKPRFEWWLGGELLQGTTTTNEENVKSGKADYIETLKYYPDSKHDGKKLRCQVNHAAYTAIQKKEKANEAEVLLKIQYPPVPSPKVQTHYKLILGAENTIRMQFNANPKPSEGFWKINQTKVQIGTNSKDNKFSSGVLKPKDETQGLWEAVLKIKDLTVADTKGLHSLTIKNEEGSTKYDFKLALGEQPPPAADSNSLTVGIIVIIVIIVLILVIVIIARAKGMMCFAAKGGDELDEEKEAFENVEKGESNAIVQESKPAEDTNLNKTPEKKADQEVDIKGEKEEKKSNGAHTPV